MTKNEVYRIKAFRCSSSKRSLLKALLIFFNEADIQDNDEKGCFIVPISVEYFIINSYPASLYCRMLRQFSKDNEIDNGFHKIYYSYPHEH